MQKRIVSVVFEGGVMSLGGTVRFGHFFEYAVVDITPATSEMLGNVIEVHVCKNDPKNTSGFFLIPMDKVEGLEYCFEDDTQETLDNFQRFMQHMEEKKRARPGLAGPLGMMPADLQQFIGGVAGDNGLELPDEPGDDDGE